MKKSNNSRTVSAVKNMAFNLAYQIVNTVVNIILPPLIIGKFGSVVNGLISTIKSIMSYIQLVGAGISESTVVSLYKPLALKDHRSTSAIYNAVGKTFNSAAALFSVASLLVAFLYPLVVEENLTYDFVVKIVLVLSISGVSELLAIGKYRALLTADQKLYIVSIAQIVGAVGSALLTFVLIKLNFAILHVQLAAAAAYVLRILILYCYIHKQYTYLDKHVRPDFNAVSKRKSATIHQVTALIIHGSQTLIISRFCGLAEASVYSVYSLIFAGLNTVLSTVSSAMLASMGNLFATESEQKVQKIYGVFELGYQILTYTCYITAMIMIRPFIVLYTRGVTDVEYVRAELVVLFTIMGLLNCLRTPGVTVIIAKGHYDETKNRAIAEMVICLVGELALVHRFNMAGVLVGTILACLYRTIDVIFYSNHKVMNQSVIITIRRVFQFAAVLILAVGIAQRLTIVSSGFISWAFTAAGVAGLSFAVALSVAFVFDKKTLLIGLDYLLGMINGAIRR